MWKFCARASRFNFAVLVGIIVALTSHSSRAATLPDPQVTVRGSGQAVLMIPGLNSAGSVWDETCAELQLANVQCHIVQLPGFAGQATTSEVPEAFLSTMRDRLLAYVAARKLRAPTVMGHSLGGVIALQMALKEPQSVGRLVVVDSLPFFPAARAPDATAQGMAPMAQSLRAGMLSAPADAYQTQLKANMAGMTRSPERQEQLIRWGLASDRATTAQAMVEMFTTDLRAELDQIHQPTLVLGSWAAYAPMGATLESTRKIFEQQYRKLPGVRIELSQEGYHFLMWDDAAWLLAQVKPFIALPLAAAQ